MRKKNSITKEKKTKESTNKPNMVTPPKPFSFPHGPTSPTGLSFPLNLARISTSFHLHLHLNFICISSPFQFQNRSPTPHSLSRVQTPTKHFLSLHLRNKTSFPSCPFLSIFLLSSPAYSYKLPLSMYVFI